MNEDVRILLGVIQECDSFIDKKVWQAYYLDFFFVCGLRGGLSTHQLFMSVSIYPLLFFSNHIQPCVIPPFIPSPYLTIMIMNK